MLLHLAMDQLPAKISKHYDLPKSLEIIKKNDSTFVKLSLSSFFENFVPLIFLTAKLNF